MNLLAQMWAKRERRRLQIVELRKIAAEVREGFASIEPLRKEAEQRRRETMRQDGPSGFVMIQR